MPLIYGVGAGGRVHRESQPVYIDKPANSCKRILWAKSAVVVDGKEYSTGAEADRAMGWRVGTTKDALRRGKGSYAGKSLAYYGE